MQWTGSSWRLPRWLGGERFEALPAAPGSEVAASVADGNSQEHDAEAAGAMSDSAHAPSDSGHPAVGPLTVPPLTAAEAGSIVRRSPSLVQDSCAECSHGATPDTSSHSGSNSVSLRNAPSTASDDQCHGQADSSDAAESRPSRWPSLHAALDALVGKLPHSKRNFQSVADEKQGSPRSTASDAGLVCLICLEAITDEQFANGKAVKLNCGCKGNAACRHTDCIVRWVETKGDNLCDICRQPMLNVEFHADETHDIEAGRGYDVAFPTIIVDGRDGVYGFEQPDYVWICVKATWCVTLICMLLLNFQLGRAIATGLIVGVAYTVMLRILGTGYRLHPQDNWEEPPRVPNAPLAHATIV